MSGEFGTENLEKLLLWGAKVSEAVVEALVDDGKINFGEGVSISLKAVGIPFKSFKHIGNELKDMDQDEKQNLIDLFSEEFDISNDEAEEKVEQAITFVLSLANMIFSAINKKQAEG